MSDLPKVRIEVVESWWFTRVYINEVELKGVTRVWFDSQDPTGTDGPRNRYSAHTRVHVDFYAADLLIEGNAEVEATEQRPKPQAAS